MEWQEVVNRIDWQRTVTTVALVIVLVVTRFLIVRQVAASSKLPKETRRRWIVRTRAALFFAILGALLLIWGTELRAFAVSLFAVAVAVVIAGKELILCLSGSTLRTASQSFSVGDKIQVKGIRGYVIDHNLLTTSMLEIGPGKSGQMQTGNLVSIPNSMFLDGAVVNETFMEEYMLHIFTVPMKLTQEWDKARKRLLEIASEECATFSEEAKKHVIKLERAHGLDLPAIDPRVILQLPDPGRIDLNVRIPVQANQRGRIEQLILSRFLAEYETFSDPVKEKKEMEEGDGAP